jgi:chromosome segregation ATPase
MEHRSLGSMPEYTEQPEDNKDELDPYCNGQAEEEDERAKEYAAHVIEMSDRGARAVMPIEHLHEEANRLGLQIGAHEQTIAHILKRLEELEIAHHERTEAWAEQIRQITVLEDKLITSTRDCETLIGKVQAAEAMNRDLAGTLEIILGMLLEGSPNMQQTFAVKSAQDLLKRVK